MTETAAPPQAPPPPPARRRALAVARQTVTEFVGHVLVEPVREGRLRDVDWPLGLRPIVVVAVVGFVAAAALVLFSGPLRELVPLSAQSGTVLLTLPRALVWIVLALTALSATLAASGALHARPWLRWLMTVFVVSVMLFTAVPDQEELPVARILTVVACVALVVFVAVRGGRGYRWWDFVVIAGLVWGPLAVTAAVLSGINRLAGYDFVPLLLSLMLSTLGQLAVPAGLAAGADVSPRRCCTDWRAGRGSAASTPSAPSTATCAASPSSRRPCNTWNCATTSTRPRRRAFPRPGRCWSSRTTPAARSTRWRCWTRWGGCGA